MGYTYEMWDEDGLLIATGLSEDDPSPREEPGAWIPVEVRGRYYGLDPDNVFLRAQTYFHRRYGREKGSDYHYRWVSIMVFLIENKEHLERAGVVQVENDELVGADPNFVRMLLESYQPPAVSGSFPASGLHEGDSGFGLFKVLNAWDRYGRSLWTPE